VTAAILELEPVAAPARPVLTPRQRAVLHLGVRGKTHAVAEALRHGLIT
jgi:DNA-binding CsgD family transcriptional regulator